MKYNLDFKSYEQLLNCKKQKSSKEYWFDASYSVFINSNIDSKEDLVKIMAFVYSWMPTVPNIKCSESFEKLSENDILSMCNRLKDDKITIDELEKLLLKLIPIVNNSIVGTSKFIHFINQNYPILDSKVLDSWNKHFNEKYKIVSNLNSAKVKNKVLIYLDYYKKMGLWLNECHENDKNITIRDLEKILFEIG